MPKIFYFILLIVSFNLVRLLKESPPFFLLVILFVFALMVQVKYFEKLTFSIRRDFEKHHLGKSDFRKRLVLGLIFFIAVFVVRKAGGVGWFFGSFDEATLLFFSLLGLLILLQTSSLTSALLAVAAISYTAFFIIYKFDKTGEIFASLTFFLFTWASLQALREKLLADQAKKSSAFDI